MYFYTCISQFSKTASLSFELCDHLICHLINPCPLTGLYMNAMVGKKKNWWGMKKKFLLRLIKFAKKCVHIKDQIKNHLPYSGKCWREKTLANLAI